MKTAILISGHSRSFASTVANQRFMLYERLHDPHFFVSVVDDEDAPALDLLAKQYEHVKIERVAQPEVSEPANLDQIIGASPHKIAEYTGLQGVLRQYWHLVRVAEFAGGPQVLGTFDRIIRLRPDTFFHSAPPKWPEPAIDEVISPWWARAGGVNDRFAVMGSDGACAYFYTLIWARNVGWPKGNPVHPESMLEASLRLQGVRINPTLATTFSLLRKSGEMILPQCSTEDLADLMIRFKGAGIMTR